MFELEVKFRISDCHAVLQKLTDRGCHLSSEIFQEDSIFVAKETKGFCITPGTPVVRIRDENGKSILTLKKKVDAALSIEHETQIENASNMAEILCHLGLKSLVKVSKCRQVGKYQQFTICFDKVEQLGYFLEIEYMSANSDTKTAEHEIMQLAQELGLNASDIEKRKYDTLVYAQNNPMLNQ